MTDSTDDNSWHCIEEAKGRFWLSEFVDPTFLRLCAAFTLLMFVMPADGVGVDLCPCMHYTHAPCPGCGMTRSGACLVRGKLDRAIAYHPFGPLVVPGIVGLGLLSVAPVSWRDRVQQTLSPWSRPLQIAFWGMLAIFVIHGILRWYFVFQGVGTFPTGGS